MKKTISIILCLLLAFSMLFTMVGCGSESSKFVGTWKAEFDMTDYMNQQFASDEEFGDYVELSSFSFDMIFVFTDDGTYSQEVDEASLTEAFDKLKDDLTEDFEGYFEDQAAALGYSVSDILAYSGYESVRDLVDESYTEDMLDEITGDIGGEGNFKVSDGKLYLSDGVDNLVDEEEYYTYEISDNTLTLLETYVSGEEDLKDFFPWTFTRIS